MLKTLLAAFSLFLVACTTSDNIKTFTPLPLEMGQSAVYIYRPTVMANALYSPDLYVNEELKFPVKNGGKSRIVLAAGLYKFKLEADNNQSKQNSLSLNLEQGTTYYLRVSTTLKVNNTASYEPYQREYSLEEVAQEKAGREIAECCSTEDKINNTEAETQHTNQQPENGFSVDKTQNPFSH